MKKFLLVAFALVFAMTINAQTEIGYADDEDWEVTAGDPDNTPLFHDGDYITWSAAFSDEWKTGGASYGTCLVNGEEVTHNGAVGSNNPTRETITTINEDGTITEVSQGTPTGCAVFQFVAKADGYLYIFAKCNTNKNYLAYEEGTRIPYSFACWRNGSSWSYDLNNIPEALVYDSSVDAYYISDTYTVQVPGYYTGDGLDTESGSVTGNDAQIAVIKFPVYAPCTYMFCGIGTKVGVGAYYFDSTGDATIITGEDYGEATIYDGGVAQGETRFPADPTGIQSTVVEETTGSSAAYNLAGQRVSKDAKGIVIMDGKKFIIK